MPEEEILRAVGVLFPALLFVVVLAGIRRRHQQRTTAKADMTASAAGFTAAGLGRLGRAGVTRHSGHPITTSFFVRWRFSRRLVSPELFVGERHADAGR
jgi:hypothetical protein